MEEIKEHMRNCIDREESCLLNTDNTKKLLEEIERLNNIIKEVREYINHYETIRGYYEYQELGYDEYNYDDDLKKELLEILDKENK